MTQLDFRRGVVAAIVRDAAGAGVRTDTLNVERLAHEIEERIPDDPWTLDRQRVVRALSDGSMRVTAIREISTVTLDLSAPDGTWYGFSPFAMPLCGGQPVCAAIGTTVWHDDRGRRLTVVRPEHGEAWCTVFD